MKLIILILAICCTQARAIPEEKFNQLVQASQSAFRVREMRQLWSDVSAYHQKYAKPLPRFHEYMEAKPAVRKLMLQSNQHLGHLVATLEVDRWIERAKADQQVLRSYAQELRNDRLKLREFLLKYHSSDDLVDDDFFDTALGIDYENNEVRISPTEHRGAISNSIPKSKSQSDYQSVRDVFRLHPPKSTDIVYDLGSGYGRLLLYGAILFPEVKFKGVEYVKERASVVQSIAARFELKNLEQVTADVMTVDYSDGTYFYLYNPFFGLMPQVLARFKEIARRKSYAIISREITTLELVREPWLKRMTQQSFYRPVMFVPMTHN